MYKKLLDFRKRKPRASASGSSQYRVQLPIEITYDFKKGEKQ